MDHTSNHGATGIFHLHITDDLVRHSVKKTPQIHSDRKKTYREDYSRSKEDDFHRSPSHVEVRPIGNLVNESVAHQERNTPGKAVKKQELHGRASVTDRSALISVSGWGYSSNHQRSLSTPDAAASLIIRTPPYSAPTPPSIKRVSADTLSLNGTGIRPMTPSRTGQSSVLNKYPSVVVSSAERVPIPSPRSRSTFAAHPPNQPKGQVLDHRFSDIAKDDRTQKRDKNISFASTRLMGFDIDDEVHDRSIGSDETSLDSDRQTIMTENLPRSRRASIDRHSTRKTSWLDVKGSKNQRPISASGYRTHKDENSPAAQMIQELLEGNLSDYDFANKLETLSSEMRRIIVQDIACHFKKLNRLLQVTNKSMAVSSELNTDSARRRIVANICTYLNAKNAFFYEVDENGKELIAVNPENADEIRMPIGQGIAGVTALTGKTCNIQEASSDERYVPDIDNSDSGATSILCIPVKDPISSKIVGVLKAVNKNDEDIQGAVVPFIPQDEAYLQTIASQTGVHIRNAKLYKASVTTQHRISVMLDLSRQMSSELNLKALCKVIMQKAKELLNADRCTLFLLDQERKELWSQVAEGAAEIRFPMNLGIAGYVATSGVTLNIPDAYDDPRFNRDIDRKTGYRTKSILCMPIINPMQQKIVGVTQMINKVSGAMFDSVDEELLQAFSAQAGIAIENSISFGETIKARVHLQQVLGSITSMVLNLKSDGRLYHANRDTLPIFGVSEQTMKEHTYVEWLGDRNTEFKNDISTVINTGQPVSSGDYTYYLPGQANISRVVNYTVVPLQNKEDGIVAIVNDITQETKLRNTLSRYMSPALAQEVMKEGSLKLGGKYQRVTVLFSDIRKFTTLSEGMGATEVVDMLNEYFSQMVNDVFNENGVLDKYIGDALMAVWGVPVTHEDDAVRACRTALQMVESLRILNNVRKARGAMPISVGIGLNSGDVVSGNIGSEKRLEYTVIGDGVNLASRIEGVTKYYGVSVLISEFTWEDLGKSKDGNAFIAREIDLVRVVGKSQPIRIFELLGTQTKPPPESKLRVQAYFKEGLSLYRESKFQEALAKFDRAHEINDDKPSLIFMERCKKFMQQPPAANWEGVWNLDEK